MPLHIARRLLGLVLSGGGTAISVAAWAMAWRSGPGTCSAK